MTHWDPPVWDPPVVGGDRTPTPDPPGRTAAPAPTVPRLPPATEQRHPLSVAPPHWPDLAQPTAIVRSQERRAPRRVPVWIRAGAACVAVAGLYAVATSGGDRQQAQPPGGVVVTGAQPSGTTIVVPPTTSPPTTAGAVPATTVAVQQLLPQPSCHPSYSPCVPVDDDVDCAGGSGNGPSYVTGPIRVTGDDEYGLDRDGDGVACEP